MPIFNPEGGMGEPPGPDRGQTNLLRAEARSLADLGDFARAREVISRALDIAPNDHELHAVMAWYTHSCKTIDLHERERLSQHHFAVSFELAPNNALAHYWQGRIFMDVGNTARARTSIETAIKLRPDFEAARNALDRLTGRAGSSTVLPMATAMLPRQR